MCLQPIQIINPTKYISLKYRDNYLLSVPCGRCAECQQTLSNQWFLRAWQECEDVRSNGSFVYFDTLTYSNSHLPYMSDILDILPKVSCFRPEDLRNFIESLRIRLKRDFNDTVSFRYFLSSEYGSLEFTNRPHYHLLFFVYGNIQPLQFSQYVSKYWCHGITDGYPYKKPSYILSHNVIDRTCPSASFLRACRYVTKYVQKSCQYDKELENRLVTAMNIISDRMPEEFQNSVQYKRVKMQLKRRLSQFHRQSKGFGASALANIDIQQLFDKGVLFMPSAKGLKIPVPLPTYYKRKLFYDLVTIDGCKTWQLNELGVQYREYRKDKLIKDLSDMFYSASATYNLNLSSQDCNELADYVYNTQGRIKAAEPSANLFEKLPSVTLFNYVTLSDKEHLNHRGIINKFIGNNSIGYTVDDLPPSYRISDFIAKYVFLDDEKEKKLNHIYYCLSKHNSLRQTGYEVRQALESKFKPYRHHF